MTAVKDSNQERIREWVAALRSGEYKQANKALKTSDGHCCLGVACVLTPESVGHFSDEKHQNDDGEITDEFDFVWESTFLNGEPREVKEAGYLPRPVGEWLGMSINEGSYDPSVLLADEEMKEVEAKGAEGFCSEHPSGVDGGSETYMQLTACNDKMEWDFDKIADLLERTYL